MQCKTIRISLENWEKLRKLGHTLETFDHIISKVLKHNGCDDDTIAMDKGAKPE